MLKGTYMPQGNSYIYRLANIHKLNIEYIHTYMKKECVHYIQNQLLNMMNKYHTICISGFNIKNLILLKEKKYRAGNM